jgi:hypothetical protein
MANFGVFSPAGFIRCFLKAAYNLAVRLFGCRCD